MRRTEVDQTNRARWASLVLQDVDGAVRAVEIPEGNQIDVTFEEFEETPEIMLYDSDLQPVMPIPKKARITIEVTSRTTPNLVVVRGKG
jgi:hypothetical protein